MSIVPGQTFRDIMLQRMLQQAQSLNPGNYPPAPMSAAMNVGFAPGMGPPSAPGYMGSPGSPQPPGPASQPPTNLLQGSQMAPQPLDLMEQMRQMQQAWMERNANNRFLPGGGLFGGGMGDML